MELALGLVVLLVAVGISVAATLRLAGDRRVLIPEREAKRDALHQAAAMLPHLRRGLDERAAAKAAPQLRSLTDATVLAITDLDSVLAVDGPDERQPADGQLLALAAHVEQRAIHVETSIASSPELCAVVAALVVHGARVGALVALYGPAYRLGPEDGRVLREAAALVCAQLELSVLAEQDERLAEAELRALRARISPHFIYNSLAAIASYIHSKPDDARRLLTEFAEFTRYAFRRERTYVTLADELHYVEKYLSLEQARFGDRLAVRVTVAPEVLGVVLPVLSLQPLVENAVRHGVEAQDGRVSVEIAGLDQGYEVELRVTDDGAGMTEDEAAAALSGRTGGIGIHNVDRRLRTAFGADYGLEIRSQPGRGTTVVMTVPKFRPGVRAA